MQRAAAACGHALNEVKRDAASEARHSKALQKRRSARSSQRKGATYDSTEYGYFSGQTDTRTDRCHRERDGADRAGRISLDHISVTSLGDRAGWELGLRRHLGWDRRCADPGLPYGHFVRGAGSALSRGRIRELLLLRGKGVPGPRIYDTPQVGTSR